MKSVTKLKEKARQFEQKEDWQRAIDIYLEVIESTGEAEPDLALLHRVGDLYIRLGRNAEAFQYYQQGVDRYAEAGLYNNAIALCNKVLRYLPDRIVIYRKVGQLSAEQGFVPDARRWFLEYAERATRAGAVNDALSALEELAGFAEDVEVLELLGRQLREHGKAEAAVPHLVRARGLRLRQGEAEAAQRLETEILAIDASASLDVPAAPEPAAAEPDELAIEPTSAVAGLGAADAAEPELATESLVEPAPAETGAADLHLEELPITGFELGEEEPAAPAVGGGIELESMFSAAGLGEVPEEPEPPVAESAPEEEELEPLPGWEDTEDEAGEPLPLLDDLDDTAEPLPLLDEQPEPLPLLGESGDEEEPAEPLPLLDAAEDEEAAEPLPLLDDARSEEPPGEEESDGSEPLPLLADGGAELEPLVAEASAEAGESLDLGDLGFDLDFGRVDGSSGPGSADGLDAGVSLQTADAAPAEPEPEPAPALAGAAVPDVQPDAAPALAAATVPDVEQELGRIRQLPEAQAADALVDLHDAFAAAGALEEARVVLDDWVRIAPDDVRAYQCRLEDEVRRGADEGALIRSYIDLADCLARTGSRTKAEAVYQRVLDLDPDNAAARNGLDENIETGLRADSQATEYVDLNAMLQEGGIEVEIARSAGESRTGAGFSGMLSQLKAKASPDGGRDDAEGHYDLGLAFKEMGLIDEAIAEFQAALRGGEERLKVYEELGQCYLLKEQYNVALKVLARALQLPRASEEELLGVYYHLGRCYEELGERGEARTAYEKVIDFDTDFMDVAGRLARL